MSAELQHQFQRIRNRLAGFYTQAEIDVWLRSPQPHLASKRPCDLIRDGKVAEIEALLDRLDTALL